MELASGKLMDQAVSIQYFKKSFYSYYLFVISFYLLLFVQLNILLYLISRILRKHLGDDDAQVFVIFR